MPGSCDTVYRNDKNKIPADGMRYRPVCFFMCAGL